MIDSGRGLENLALLLYEMEDVTPERAGMLRKIFGDLSGFRSFTLRESSDIPPVCRKDFGPPDSAEAEQFYQCLCYNRSHMLNMIRPEKQKRYRSCCPSRSGPRPRCMSAPYG